MIKQKNVTVLIRSIAQTGLMFALMVILMIIEGIFPPIPSMPPGVKLGLSNVVIMFSLLFIGINRTALLVFLKVSFVFITRGATAFLLSLFGSFLSVLIMFLLLKLTRKGSVSFMLLSVSGAIAHNVGQLFGAFILLKSSTVFFYFPILLISGVIFGVISATVLKVIMPHMSEIKKISL